MCSKLLARRVSGCPVDGPSWEKMMKNAPKLPVTNLWEDIPPRCPLFKFWLKAWCAGDLWARESSFMYMYQLAQMITLLAELFQSFLEKSGKRKATLPMASTSSFPTFLGKVKASLPTALQGIKWFVWPCELTKVEFPFFVY